MLAAIGSLATGLVAAQAGPRAYALVGNTLLRFDVEHPQLVGTPIPITGMFGGEIMVGIDIRPMNGHLYGIAISQAGGSVQLYPHRAADRRRGAPRQRGDSSIRTTASSSI